MGPKCDRIFIGLSVFFCFTTLAAVGVLCWREFFVDRHEKTEAATTPPAATIPITRENLIRMYPSIFQIYDTKYDFKNLVLQGTNNLTPVNQTFDDGKTCSFSCDGKGLVPGRRKRATSNDVYHACCVSNMNFISPDTMHNIFLAPRLLVHLPQLRQVFKTENCSQAIGCNGCKCMHQMDLATALVYKPGFTRVTAKEIDHLEIDFFYLPGCCKCINVQLS